MPKYLPWIRRAPDEKPIDVLLDLLAPSRRREELEGVFDGRALHRTIWDWRKGRKGIPQWAAVILAAKVRAYLADHESRVQRMLELHLGAGLDWDRTAHAFKRYRYEQAQKRNAQLES